MNTELIILNLMTARDETLRDADDSSRRDERGWTPLHAVVAFNDSDKVKELLKDCGTRNCLCVSNNDGWTPLHIAAALNGNPRAVGVALEEEHNSKLAVLDQLLKANADRNARNKDGWTPLHVAAALNSNAEVVKRLLIDPAAPAPMKDGKGRTPLHLAAAHNSTPEVITYLLGDRCDGATAQTNDQEKASGDANARANNYSTPLHAAATKATNPETVKRLLKRGADPNARNKAGFTPLRKAARKTRNPEIVKALLNGGADPRLRNEKGQMPIDLAEKNKRLRGTEVYWQLHDARYLAHRSWDG